MQAWEEKYYEREEGRAEGRAEGELYKIISLIQKKHLRGKSLNVIAEELEESPADIERIYSLICQHADKQSEDIFQMLREEENENQTTCAADDSRNHPV